MTKNISDKFIGLSRTEKENVINKIIPSICSEFCCRKCCDGCFVEELTDFILRENNR